MDISPSSSPAPPPGGAVIEDDSVLPDNPQEDDPQFASQQSLSQLSEHDPIASSTNNSTYVPTKLVPGGPPIRVTFSKSLQVNKSLGPQLVVELGSMPMGRPVVDLRADSGTVGLFTCTKDSMKLDIKSDVFEGTYVPTAGTIGLLTLTSAGEAKIEALMDSIFRAKFSHNALTNLRGTVEGEVDPSKFRSDLDRNVNLERGPRKKGGKDDGLDDSEDERFSAKKRAKVVKKKKKPSAKKRASAGKDSAAKKKRKIDES